MKYAASLGAALAILAAGAFAASANRTEANNGNLVMEDVPAIPAEIVDDLNRYQNVRSANFEGWQEDGSGILVTTRFADVDQLHRVDMPGGARHQLTYYGAGSFCAGLERRYIRPREGAALTRELRRFYRLDQRQKLKHIESARGGMSR